FFRSPPLPDRFSDNAVPWKYAGFGAPPFHRLPHDQRRKRVDILLQQHQKAHEPCEQQTMEEYETKDPPLVTLPTGGGTRNADALRVDHLAHHTASAVGRSHEHGTQP